MPTFEFSIFNCQFSIFIVRLTGLEPARRETLDPKSSASTNSATGAFFPHFLLSFVLKAVAKVRNIFYSTKSLRANSINVSIP